MSNASSQTDPFAAWKQMFDQFEQAFSKPLQETLNSEAFAATLGDTRERQIASQQAMREGMEKYLQSMRVPTKSDHAALAAQVVALETKIEALEDRFDVVEDKLDQILAKLSTLNSAPAAAPAAPKSRRSR
ncbi:hypothetical protein J7643_13590 [bacterium]|nr:hypothetical protein [bacterium]